MGEEILIFDCDPGIDDAIALGFLSGIIRNEGRKNIKVFILSTWGNVSLEYTFRNSMICKSIFKIPAEIVKGRDRSVRGDVIHAEKVHGKDGLGGYSDKYFKGFDNFYELDEFIRRIERDDQSKIDIISTGPLSSSYELLKNKNIRERIQKFVWMGGAFFEDGNITPYAEFNSYCDPDALDYLFEFAKEKRSVYVVPLDSTKKTQIRRDNFLKMLNSIRSETVKEFLSDITERANVLILHDPLAIFAYFFPEHVRTFTAYAEVDKVCFRGRIRSIISPDQFLHVVYDFNKEVFFNELMKSLGRIY